MHADKASSSCSTPENCAICFFSIKILAKIIDSTSKTPAMATPNIHDISRRFFLRNDPQLDSVHLPRLILAILMTHTSTPARIRPVAGKTPILLNISDKPGILKPADETASHILINVALADIAFVFNASRNANPVTRTYGTVHERNSLAIYISGFIVMALPLPAEPPAPLSSHDTVLPPNV